MNDRNKDFAVDERISEVASAETFERLLVLSVQALEALESGDLDAVGPIFDEREKTIAESGVDGEAPGRSRPATRRSAPTAELAEQLKRADARLALALASRRDEIGRDLEALQSRGPARTAYGPRGRAASSINIVR